MVNNKLQKARDYVKQNAHLAAPELPMLHLTGEVGWINDPNGFAPYKGEYHLFYQYHPYGITWGPMHWGHAKTRDFIRWEQLPVVMAPDESYDQDGCFSGGAVEMPDGRHLLMYTGVEKRTLEDGSEIEFQTQCLAFGDGVNYEKYEHNPVITARNLPEGGDYHDFRDPHIWLENGTYFAIAANRMGNTGGAIHLFRSEDALQWDYVTTLDSCNMEYGSMWECPDFFRLDGKDILFVSPQEMPAIGLEFHPGNGNVCFVGHMDENGKHLVRESAQSVDYGLDFYAMQALETYDGRRVMVGWMQNWQTVSAHPENLHFFGQMTLPRELCIRNGRLCQLPVRELERYRCERITYQNIPVTGDITPDGIRGRFLDLTVVIRPESRNFYRSFTIELACDSTRSTEIRYTPAEGILRIDRTRSGLPCDTVNIREFPVEKNTESLKLRFILDRYSIELFVNDGEQAASNIIYTPLTADGIRFRCDGSAQLDVEQYTLNL